MSDKKQMYEIVLTDDNNVKEISEGNKYFQVDALKAVMIFLVIFDHMVSWGIKSNIGVTLWERISIPIFLVIMGFNMGKSFQLKGDLSLRELYSWSYFKGKIIRYVIPFLILYAFSTFIGLFMYGFDLSAMYHGQYYPNHGFINLFIGFLPFWGPGNWFLPLLFQSILILPLLFKLFQKKPILSLILCFIVEISMQLIVFFFIGEITSWNESHILTIFMTSVLFYLSAIGLGMWFSFGHKLEDRRNFFMWIIYPISLAFIVAFQFFGFRIIIGGVPLLRGDYLFLIFPYSAFLFLLAMKFLPQKSEGRISKAISLIGKSTYHILLIQIFGFGMIFAIAGTHYVFDVGFRPDDFLDLIFAWIMFISFGILWYKIDRNKDILRRSLYYINLFIIFASLLIFILWIQVFWVPIPLLIIIIYAIIALITSVIIRKPFDTKILGLWTMFLLTTFLMLILQVVVLQSNIFWVSFVPIGVTLVLAIIETFVVYVSKK
ncbi:MAG: acyltransferase family protein [Candidatus Hodarchaeales archaeon]|jgi:peptidoglycan/LPS O-acetylase OafA/YrhL